MVTSINQSNFFRILFKYQKLNSKTVNLDHLVIYGNSKNIYKLYRLNYKPQHVIYLSSNRSKGKFSFALPDVNHTTYDILSYYTDLYKKDYGISWILALD